MKKYQDRTIARFGISLGVMAIALASGPALHAQDTSESENRTDQPGYGDSTVTDPVQLPREADSAFDEATAYKEIVVTGTNISGVKNVGSETVVLSREDVLSTGRNSVADVLRTLPQVQNVGSFTAASNGGNAQGGGNATRGNAINLRGVGQGATLTLVDGHRVTPSGTAGAFSEANQVPIAAIERIEVIADGASAIYGSDAIAGVINYVLRKDFQGVELGGRYTIGAYNNDEYALTGTVGTKWDTGMGSGNIIATYEYFHRDPYLRGRNARLRADQRGFGGQDDRVVDNAATAAYAGNVVIPTADGLRNPLFPQGGAYTYYAVPDNPTGAPLTAADLREVRLDCDDGSCVGYPNLVDRTDYEDYLGELDRHQVAVFFNQEIGDFTIYDQAFYTHSKQFTRTYLSGNSVTSASVYIDPENPAYIDGLPNTVRSSVPGAFPAVQQPLVVQMNLLARMPDGAPRFGNQNPDESFTNTFGVRSGLFGDWNWETYYTYGQNKSCGVCYLGNYISLENNASAINLLYDPIGSVPQLGLGLQNALQNLIDRPEGDPLRVNPFATTQFTQDQLDYILGTNSQYGQNYSHDVVMKLDGSLAQLPGGTMKAAIGGEYYYGIQKLQNAANRPPDPGYVTTPDADARSTREQYAVFGEIYLPLVGYDMDVPLMEELTLSGALRYDHYSDFGSTTNPKISANWMVNQSLSFRGSWGTSFRAPGLPELNAGVFSVGVGLSTTLPPGVDDIPNDGGVANTLLYIGNNPNLKAETGTNWQVGMDFTPTSLPGFKFTTTYYNISYNNKLGSAPNNNLFLATAENREIYSAYIVPINNPDTCVNSDPSTFDPNLVEYASFLYQANAGVNPRDYCGIDVVLDGRGLSAAKTMQDGIDLSLDYVTGTDAGRFGFNLGVSHILSSKSVTVAGNDPVDTLDTIGDPISWRGRGNISYATGPFSATLFGNYTGGYTNDAPLTIAGELQPEQEIGSWTTFDLNLSLSFDRGDNRFGFMDGLRLSATVTNLFDKDPPIVNSALTPSSSIDLTAHNAYGRYVQFQVTKSF
ncbi:TonB-dependent receptor domain-containing protein [Altericroceibacterium endophyticum]|uniref:TonB-dependent receptor n=1 Tax=Altericroceibacterium endophyticum TaxID=1808508 RepID=A0A6I4T4C5_9SPHN|nr:TonB-dependent receptor [Altericroceibacterium endophyticum]MXO65757.1 TonB-dependent receptor [Altericroceibacterium endophyticum]